MWTGDDLDRLAIWNALPRAVEMTAKSLSATGGQRLYRIDEDGSLWSGVVEQGDAPR
jgi:hypothetical protein